MNNIYNNSEMPRSNGYEDLAMAIIYTAVKDYQTAYKHLWKANKKKKKLLEEAQNYPNVFMDVYQYKEAHRRMHLDALQEKDVVGQICRENYLRNELSKVTDKETQAIRTIRDCESFFNGSWIDLLTNLGGKNIKAKVDYELMRKGIKLIDEFHKEN